MALRKSTEQAQDTSDPSLPAMIADILDCATTDLHPDLAPYIVATTFGDILKHPLVFQWGIATPAMKGMANAQYEAKRQAVEQARDECDWHSYVALHERPYRIAALAEVPRTAEDYWQMVSLWWVDTEYPSLIMADWLAILADPQARAMMDEDEQAVFEGLPEAVVVYRGVGEGGIDNGLSWTLKRTCAEWFAARFGTGHVVERTVPKADIVAYVNRRNEQEVILLP